MTEQNNGPAPLTAEVAQMVAWLRGSARRLTECTFADAADMLTALATQLAERDAELARVTAERDEFRNLFLAGMAPIPVSSDIADIVAAVEEWVNMRGSEDTADQIAVMAIQSYQRASKATSHARIATLTKALTFYAEGHSKNPNEGPWGMASTDFGTIARAALTTDKEPKT